MKTLAAILLLPLCTTLLISGCTERSKTKMSRVPIIKESPNISCDDFWAVYNPEDSIKIHLLEECIEKNELTPENKKLLLGLIKEINQSYSYEELSLTIEYPLFPIHRLKADQIGILGYSLTKQINGQWEDFSKEDQLLKKDFGYQSIDSMGKLVSFSKVFNKLYPLIKPSIYWFSTNKRTKSTVTDLLYMGDDCLSYFHYNFNLTEKDKTEKIVIGSPFALDLDFRKAPELDKKFAEQYGKTCLDCPSNYPDQTIFAQLKGSNLYFAQADSWPINDKLSAPIRSLVMLTKDGKLVTIWNSELDLFGCGCL